jgi:anti-sigma regulatory factor (Ser/Thr protein kinase)/CheY-like chemotaxis protein
MREKAMSRVLILESGHEVSKSIATALAGYKFEVEWAAGSAQALRHLRERDFQVVITDPNTSVDEDLALLDEMRQVRPGVNLIALAPHSAATALIAALRARVFGCFSPPFNASEIALLAADAAVDHAGADGIHILSARPGWVTVRLNCRQVNADRMVAFIKEAAAQLPEEMRAHMVLAFREVLVNAMEHGAAFNPEQMVEVTAVRTRRAILFYVRDPGLGFKKESLAHAAINNPASDPSAHMRLRLAEGMRPGGFGIMLAGGAVDELIYNEIGNEVILIKYVDKR